MIEWKKLMAALKGAAAVVELVRHSIVRRQSSSCSRTWASKRRAKRLASHRGRAVLILKRSFKVFIARRVNGNPCFAHHIQRRDGTKRERKASHTPLLECPLF